MKEHAIAGGGDQITEDTNVEELITRFPAAARVFVRRRMSCLGCDIARFESLADVCRIYRQPVEQFLDEIRHLVREQSVRPDPPVPGEATPPTVRAPRGMRTLPARRRNES